MNVARRSHGSCALSTSVYVLCGLNYAVNPRFLNSIEKLETRNLQSGWQLVKMSPKSLLTPRTVPIVAALNENEILIMGGDDGEHLADALTFETRNHSLKVVVQVLPFKFRGWEGCVQIRCGTIFAQVIANSDKVMIIKYKNGSIQSLYPE